ncbi:MAG: sugar phosphate isomerase/epimerase family protein [Armatimonadota bacterium]|nr:sugar phosphate isomerase/epimerase family protein [Armatimonadota bacterium]MDR5674934.1 sugar phosphate isomerase/epimerase family protein [Armatimonadota bacterium]MDR5688800.1 sugar phosphate isomerase/epimerase family protein [Armatimonadota bacterium]MDR7387375.1 sugar phosphate isomerase/epimerase family protein [Armatimonadota bacterium]MDR7388689.1 sugar phosphate isomerase/epimerase family protein [Armatimonadota bacterium]
MRLAYAVAAPDGGAPPLAWCGPLEAVLERVRAAGFEGVELYVVDPGRLDPVRLAGQLGDAGLSAAAVCTGEVYGRDRLYLSARDGEVRRAAMARSRAIIDFAAALRVPVNVGRLRGPAAGDPEAARRALDALAELATYAQGRGTYLVLEPVNHHELDLVNTTSEGISWVRQVNEEGLRLMLDLYHVHLADVSVPAAFVTAWAAGVLAHVHVCDSNRLAPGWGHLPLRDVLAILAAVGYTGWVTVECLQRPSPEETVRQAGSHLRRLLEELRTSPAGFRQ